MRLITRQRALSRISGRVLIILIVLTPSIGGDTSGPLSRLKLRYRLDIDDPFKCIYMDSS